jgi:hypothetical protein
MEGRDEVIWLPRPHAAVDVLRAAQGPGQREQPELKYQRRCKAWRMTLLTRVGCRRRYQHDRMILKPISVTERERELGGRQKC